MQYDRFQKESIDYINQGYSVIVSAPTGAGKTVIAEYVISNCLKNNEKAIYTAPIKALSNQKFRDFQVQYSEYIGILTGDVSINPNASVLIMTTEIFRNKVLEEQNLLKDYKWIIFDEIHYLDDPERGTVWEESIILLPPHIRILALSATIPNIDELARWINSIHRIELKVVKENKRPVPLHFCFQYIGKIIDNFDDLRKAFFKNKKKYFCKEDFYSNRIQWVSNLIEYMNESNRLPCIYFSFNRRRCEELAETMGFHNFLSSLEEKEIIKVYDSLCQKFDLEKEEGAAHLYPLIKHGIAYHHAGMLPTLKEVIERLFTSGLLKVIFTTETFALGINMPARSVIFDELYKNYGSAWHFMKTRDFYQMAGRAGRRGIDESGFVWCRINQQKMRWDQLKRIIYGEPERVVSQLNTSYATLLHLYQDMGEKLYEVYPRSFHFFQSRIKEQERVIKQMHDKISILKELGHIKNNRLTPKGLFASQVYGYELPLAELYEKEYFEQMNKYELGVLFLSFVYEPRKNNGDIHRVSRQYRSIAKKVERENKKVKTLEICYGIKPLSKMAYFGLSTTLEAWMKGEEFEKILTYSGEDEGEIVRYFRMTIQILKEIQKSDTLSDNLRTKASQALKCINRGVIDAEKQLRTV
ncbi:DEAD/DEAH box helicase [Candidatus Poribacteria bacterium]|nr:DEAD/DEAH box helicase [Candidatus Poribacteria bacterium]